MVIMEDIGLYRVKTSVSIYTVNIYISKYKSTS